MIPQTSPSPKPPGVTPSDVLEAHHSPGVVEDLAECYRVGMATPAFRSSSAFRIALATAAALGLWAGLALHAQASPAAAPGRQAGSAVPAAPRLQVTHAARAVAPGEAVLVTVTAPEPLAGLEARVFGRTFPGYRGGEPRTWHVLLGLDLETRPGRARVAIEARTADGKPLTAIHPLAVAAKAFPTRRLTVAPGFVTPPASEAARIERERLRMAEVLAVVTPEPQWAGGFARPTAGAVISLFGARSVYNGQPRSPHRGVDLRGATGTPVVAPAAGTVALAGDLYFSGTTVVIDHGLGVHSMLGHLSRIDVREGATVAPGDAVGAVGATGRVTGPHLHWTLRIGATSVDPMSVLDLLAPSAQARRSQR